MVELKNRNVLIMLIVSGVVIFALGATAGAIYQNQKSAKSAGVKNLASTQRARSLGSGVVSSIAFLGRIDSISGKVFKISSNGETVQITASENAIFYTIDNSSGKPVQKPASISNAKVGDRISINAKIAENGSYTATSAIIFPQNPIK